MQIPKKSKINIGDVFNRWTVIGPWIPGDSRGGAKIVCRCECGRLLGVRPGALKSGGSKSCGCLRSEMISKLFSMSLSDDEKRLRAIRRSMLQRCHNETHKDYRWYGERGIRVCEDWVISPEAFTSWCLKNGYRVGLDLDRIDNTLGYSPENCRFVTHKVNCLNRPNHPIGKRK